MSFLKSTSTAICAVLVLLTASIGVAQINDPSENKAFPIESIIGARWIDRENNTMSLRFLSLYPNGCYSLDSTAGFTATAERKIYISQTVNISDQLCTQAIVSLTDETTVLIPEPGEYEIIDALTNKTLGKLVVNNGEFAYYKE